MIGIQKRWQEDLFIAGPLSSFIPDDHILKQVDNWVEGMHGEAKTQHWAIKGSGNL